MTEKCESRYTINSALVLECEHCLVGGSHSARWLGVRWFWSEEEEDK